MSVDVFGRHLITEANGLINRGPPGVGFKLTADANYDLCHKRLCNVAPATDPNDAVTLEILNEKVQLEVKILQMSMKAQFDELYEQIDELKQKKIPNKKINRK